jgi:hypothetical protein
MQQQQQQHEGLPSYKVVVFFHLTLPMTRTISSVSIEAVKQRMRRLRSKVNLAMFGTVPWADQSAQEEVDEFYQTMLAFIQPGLEEHYSWWVQLERLYLERKLRMYQHAHAAICRGAGITKRKNSPRQQQLYNVPWSTNDHSDRRHSNEGLAWSALSPLDSIEDARRMHQFRFPHVASLTDERQIADLNRHLEETQALINAAYEAHARQQRQQHYNF